ncbi:hypothetical protein LWI29_019726 [Acer saccharum]|uniref:Uncharacterized protein n=1 Tax=Acer saccharum TaxID=4024 RepID=A0AA39RI32_ACESA|nr:hypothetical protein LWI29_019726 [Acer saccharum]
MESTGDEPEEMICSLAPGLKLRVLKGMILDRDMRRLALEDLGCVSAVPVENGPSMAQFGNESVGLKEKVGRVEGFFEMEVDSGLATNKSQSVTVSGGNVEENGGAGKTAGPKGGSGKDGLGMTLVLTVD